MQTISIETLRGQAKARVDEFEAKARERMGDLRGKTTAGLKQVGDQARAQVDRFEHKAKERLDAMVDRLHRALDLPSHQDIEQVKVKLAQLEVRLDDLKTSSGAVAFAVPPVPAAELPEFAALHATGGPGTPSDGMPGSAAPGANGGPSITAGGASARRRK